MATMPVDGARGSFPSVLFVGVTVRTSAGEIKWFAADPLPVSPKTWRSLSPRQRPSKGLLQLIAQSGSRGTPAIDAWWRSQLRGYCGRFEKSSICVTRHVVLLPTSARQSECEPLCVGARLRRKTAARPSISRPLPEPSRMPPLPTTAQSV